LSGGITNGSPAVTIILRKPVWFFKEKLFFQEKSPQGGNVKQAVSPWQNNLLWNCKITYFGAAKQLVLFWQNNPILPELCRRL